MTWVHKQTPSKYTGSARCRVSLCSIARRGVLCRAWVRGTGARNRPLSRWCRHARERGKDLRQVSSKCTSLPMGEGYPKVLARREITHPTA